LARQETGEAGGKLHTLEAGRFIAALVVMFFHIELHFSTCAANPAATSFGGMFFPGQLGVQYFFVLSGFVMASVHHGDFGNIKAIPKFWWRRICRIYPAYWLALIIPVYFAYAELTPGSAVSLVLLDPWHTREFILAAWSLRYELVFYIMFGLAMLPYVGKPLLAFWVFFTLWRWSMLNVFDLHPEALFVVNHYAGLYAYEFVQIFEFYFFGGLAAGYIFVKCRFGARLCWGLLIAGAVAALCLLPEEAWGTEYGDPWVSVAMSGALGALLLGLAGLERQGRIRLGRWAVWGGVVSYPLYVVHVPAMMLMDHVLGGLKFGSLGLYIYFVLMSAGTLITATLVAFLYDQPVQRLLRRLTRRMWPGEVKGRPGAPPLDPAGPEAQTPLVF
jgi:peptidoglycan/LPS O-acetylase OafA/YrhL